MSNQQPQPLPAGVKTYAKIEKPWQVMRVTEETWNDVMKWALTFEGVDRFAKQVSYSPSSSDPRRVLFTVYRFNKGIGIRSGDYLSRNPRTGQVRVVFASDLETNYEEVEL